MSFGVLKFGEKCDRHPDPKFRGQDNRSHVFAPPRPKIEATKLQATGDWAYPNRTQRSEEETARQRDLTTSQRAAIRQISTTSGLAQGVAAAGSAASSAKVDKESTTTTNGRRRPGTAGSVSAGNPFNRNPHETTREVSSTTTSLGVNLMKKRNEGGLTTMNRKQIDELQMSKNRLAGMKMPANLPQPVNMHEVVGKIEQPKNFVPPAKPLTGVESLRRQLELESSLDSHVKTIQKYIEVKSNFGTPQQQASTLSRLLKGGCTAKGEEMVLEDFVSAIAVFQLSMTEDEREGLFDRFDLNENGSLSFREVSDGLLGRGKKIPGASVEARGLLADLKMKILKRNPNSDSVRSFTRSFRLLNKDKSRDGLTSDELFNGLQKIGIRIPLDQVQKLVKFFDTGRDGKISQSEFLTALRGRMSLRRKRLVKKAYGVLDTNKDGDITLEEISAKYNTADHPEVKSGEKTEEEVLRNFTSSWDQSGDSVISWKEFLTYYKDISSGIELDDYFELMIRNAWHIPGGEGVCANTANRRVLVIHQDGSQSVEMLEDDLGIGPKDIAKMKLQLEKQGITDIKSIQLAG